MAQIKNINEYEATMARIEELLPQTWEDNVPENSPENIELNILSELAAEYEESHFPIKKPTLVDTIKLRMFDYGYSQKKTAEILGISPSKMSAIINGKVEPTITLGRTISQKLNIEPEIILGL